MYIVYQGIIHASYPGRAGVDKRGENGRKRRGE
jgi:hypothetical protein